MKMFTYNFQALLQVDGVETKEENKNHFFLLKIHLVLCISFKYQLNSQCESVYNIYANTKILWLLLFKFFVEVEW